MDEEDRKQLLEAGKASVSSNTCCILLGIKLLHAVVFNKLKDCGAF